MVTLASLWSHRYSTLAMPARKTIQNTPHSVTSVTEMASRRMLDLGASGGALLAVEWE